MPFTNLLSKGMKFVWDSYGDDAFVSIKEMSMCALILSTPDFGRRFILYADASHSGVGGVLVQEKQGIKHAQCYFSKKVSIIPRKLQYD